MPPLEQNRPLHFASIVPSTVHAVAPPCRRRGDPVQMNIALIREDILGGRLVVQVFHRHLHTDDNAATVADIRIRLDGLPLALELADARFMTLTPETLLAHLDARRTLAIEGARDLPARQRTLRAEIGWSHDLLPEPDRRLLRRLVGARLRSIPGGCRSRLRIRVG